MIAAIAFYVFAFILLIAGAMVVTARNPVHSVLFLILAFFNAAALFVLAGAEFLAMILVVVYVGAVAVLFLFVVMMLDINFAELRSGVQRYWLIGVLVGAVLTVELLLIIGTWQIAPEAMSLRFSPTATATHNTAQLGNILYTDYVFLFQAAGLVLLVAMIGAIVLTLRDRQASRRQSIAEQVARVPQATLEMVDVPVGAGVAVLGIRRPKVAEEPATEDAHADAHDHGHDDGHGGH
jgi:NADH-quinone oxidoreductase subunit J